MTHNQIIAEMNDIEASPLSCLPDPECDCPTCARYCELWGMLDAIHNIGSRT